MAIRTIFSTVEDCSRGVYEGWYELVRDYAPATRTILSHYFASLQPDLDAAVTDVFAKARANDNAWFRSLRFANEREFAMAFRDLVFASGRAAARLPGPNISADDVLAQMDGLSLIQKQLFWVFLKGWDVAQASAMLMNASATASGMSAVTTERLGRLLPNATVERILIALVAMEAAQARRTDDCLPLKTFNNVINGQISWNDREAAERHIESCMHCLDAYTGFQEMIWLQKNAVPLAKLEAEAITARLGVQSAASKGLLSRLLSRAS